MPITRALQPASKTQKSACIFLHGEGPESLPRLWHALPNELKERVLKELPHEHYNLSIYSAAQTCTDWFVHTRWAHPKVHQELQQRLMLMTLTGALEPEISSRTRNILQRHEHVAFHLVRRRAKMESALHELPDGSLRQMQALLNTVQSIDLNGLKQGPRLFARWAAFNGMLANVRSLRVDGSLLTHENLQVMCGAAKDTPLLQRFEQAQASPEAAPAVEAGFKEMLPPCKLDFAGWTKLTHLNLRDCQLNVEHMHLQSNTELTILDVSGNFAADKLLLSRRSPGSSLRTLIVSNDFWSDNLFELPGIHFWRQELQTLVFRATQVTDQTAYIAKIDTHAMPRLENLICGGHVIDYSQTTLQSEFLRTIDLSATGLSMDNMPRAGLFSHKSLWRILLQKNDLRGVLNKLNLFAGNTLSVLDLSNTQLTTQDLAIWSIPQGAILTHLELSDNEQLCDMLPALTSKNLTELTHLGLRMHGKKAQKRICSDMLALASLRKYWPKLRCLSIFLHQVTNPQAHEAVLDLLDRERIELGDSILAQ